MQKKVVIYGIGDLANHIFRLLKWYTPISVAAFTADGPFIRSKAFLDLPLVDFKTIEITHPPEDFDMLVLIGYRRMRDRKLLFDKAKAKGYGLVNYLAPGSHIAQDVVLGENNLIFPGATIDAFVEIGHDNIVRPNTLIGHNLIIGNHNYIAPGCSIGGFSRIHDLCYIGIGSTIIDHVILADETLIGAGSLVMKNTEPATLNFGRPAQKKGVHPDTGILVKGHNHG